MVYIGIDPSYTKTGVSYIDLEDRVIVFKAVTPEGTNESYSHMVHRAIRVGAEILADTRFEPTILIVEEPLLTSQRASALGILSGSIMTQFLGNSDIQNIYTINPNVVSSTNRGLKGYTSKTRKKISQEITLEYLKVFKEHNYKIIIYNDKLNKDGSMKQRVISTDESESFIMLILLLKHLNLLPEEILKPLIKTNIGLKTKYEINKLK